MLGDPFLSDVYISKRQNANYSVFTVVNAYNEEKETEFTLEAEGKRVRFYNAVSGEITEISSSSSNGKVMFRFALPSDTTGFFVVS